MVACAVDVLERIRASPPADCHVHGPEPTGPPTTDSTPDANWDAIFAACPGWYSYAGPICPTSPDSCTRDPNEAELAIICGESSVGTDCHAVASQDAGAADAWNPLRSGCSVWNAVHNPQAEVQRLSEWSEFFAWVVQSAKDHYDTPAAFEGCKRISQAWADMCAGVTDTSMCALTAGGTNDIQRACCQNVHHDSTGTMHAELVNSCDDADTDWRREQSTKHCAPGDSGCFDDAEEDCCDACNGDPSSDTYKASCTGTGYQGPSICGTDTTGAGLPVWPYAKECSTGPDHELTPDEDCDHTGTCHERCSFSAADVEAYFSEWTTSRTTIQLGNSTTDAGSRAAGGMLDLFRAFVITSPDAVIPASLNINVKQCAAVALDPYTNANINVQSGDAYVYNPSSVAPGSISISGSANAMVVGGSNGGSITCSSTGRVRIAHLQNDGPVEVHGGADIFLANVENNGEVRVTDTSAVLMDIINNAKVVVSGSSQAYAHRISNHGEIVVQAGSNLVLHLSEHHGSLTFQPGSGGAVFVPPHALGAIDVPADGSVNVTYTDAAWATLWGATAAVGSGWQDDGAATSNQHDGHASNATSPVIGGSNATSPEQEQL